ncbi:hypothetical protein KOI35_11050 [Actinoplanes bogorensis]|uniref:ABC transporter permease n=1 Tax=Paractinoplanes bogorensis TaxID=1610840 RepID=A0ABS5YKS3_9ACTN|nr:hypothetical protein [Actinoplanes bogorensis]MBU2664027.1 hypothetical protein [Actinoplanes bogorensis]
MTTTAFPVRVLARREIRHYLGSWLYWVGTALLALTLIPRDASSTAAAMIAPSALIGVFGIIIMAGLTRRSDRAAAAAGSVAVPERARTLALAAAVVVPVVTALLWYVAAVIIYFVDPPAPETVPFPPFGDGHVLTVMFALSVVPALSGPILGLVLARWLPRRGVVPLAVVLVVLITIVMQGNFESTWHWRVIWPWTYWYGPIGWNTGDDQWVALPGSPQLWIVYLLAICAVGVLVALYHDPESDRSRLRMLIGIGAAVAVVAVVLTMVLGLPDAVPNPLTA